MTSTKPGRKTVAPTTLRGRLRADERLKAPGWVLLPLRLFLGITFVYAGLSKLFDPTYLDSTSPLGVHSQMLRAAATSPISGLVSASAEHATVTGLLIAIAELAVGVGTLLGLLSRAAALGGLLLALSFFLTVSWTTRPYFYGPDIVFVFAWLPLVAVGDGGVLSLSSVLRARARRAMHLPEEPPGYETEYVLNEVGRRTLVGSALVAGVVAVVVAPAGAVLALARRGSSASTQASAATPSPTAAASSPASPGASQSAAASPAQSTGPVIAAAASVAVGTAKSFTAPNGEQAYLLHPSESSFVALSATCTHEGCPVSFVGPGFQCPCHGATYDATGQPTGGPAQGPLASIPVAVKDGNVVVA